MTAPFSVEVTASICFQAIDRFAPRRMPSAKRSQPPPIALNPSGPLTGAAQGRISGARTIGGGEAHRLFTAAQNCSVTAALSSATFQPFVSAFSLANLCSI